MTVVALDTRELVLSGLSTVLTAQLAGLVTQDNIHASWQQVNLAGAIGTGPGQQAALVILDLGNETPQQPQPIKNERFIALVPAQGATTTTRYIPDQAQCAPLLVTCAAAGETAETTAMQIAATIKTALGQTYTLALPDDNTTSPPTFTNGLQGTLIRMGGRWHTRDAERQVYAWSLVYEAYYTDWHTDTPTLARTVTINETLDEGLVQQTHTITRTHA